MNEHDSPDNGNADLDAFRPLIATAWKKDELSDLELAAVCLEIMRDPTLNLSCRDALTQWLNTPGARARLREHTTVGRFAAAS